MNLTLSSSPKTLILPHNSRSHAHLSKKLHAGKLAVQSPASETPVGKQTGVIIIGGGLSGLAAATHLHSNNIPFLLVEASDGVGGRVRTDSVDGFLLDRGFQIFITAYPEARRLLDYNSLDLQKFYSGAMIYYNGGFHTVSDPFRHFLDAVISLANPIGTIVDKLLIGVARFQALNRSDEDILTAEEIPIMERLRLTGFSDSIIDRFFRPFFGGIFFDKELQTTSRLFDFILKCLALGDNTLPAKGIRAIPDQLAGKLPSDSILLNSKVVSINFGRSETPAVRLHSGEVLQANLGVVVAVEEPEAEKLLTGRLPIKPKDKPVRSTVCLYFSANRSPVQKPVLILNGSGEGILNNMFFATDVASTYAPVGKTLVSVSLIGTYEDVSDEELSGIVIREVADWFGESVVKDWKHLRTYRIPFAQPNQSPPTDITGKSSRIGEGVYVCGDYRVSATFDGALVSGRKAVEALLKTEFLSKA